MRLNSTTPPLPFDDHLLESFFELNVKVIAPHSSVVVTTKQA